MMIRRDIAQFRERGEQEGGLGQCIVGAAPRLRRSRVRTQREREALERLLSLLNKELDRIDQQCLAAKVGPRPRPGRRRLRARLQTRDPGEVMMSLLGLAGRDRRERRLNLQLSALDRPPATSA